VDALKGVREAAWQVEDLVCYLMNLADDLNAWLAQGMVAPEVLPQMIQELREIAEALCTTWTALRFGTARLRARDPSIRFPKLGWSNSLLAAPESG